jgi:hypothetical protein
LMLCQSVAARPLGTRLVPVSAANDKVACQRSKLIPAKLSAKPSNSHLFGARFLLTVIGLLHKIAGQCQSALLESLQHASSKYPSTFFSEKSGRIGSPRRQRFWPLKRWQ